MGEVVLSSDAIFVQELSLGGALHGAGAGLKVGVKDSIDIAGYATRLGSAVYADAPQATRHAAVVHAVLAAGCSIVGKTTMHELAYGVTGINGWSGTPVNPRYPDRVPGGSSSGSAVAVAASLVDFALGTDTGGSIRIPAASCGIVGLKTTYGRVSREGVHPRTSSLDCVGPFARELSMIERAMSLIDPTFILQKPPASIRLGMVNVAAEPVTEPVIDEAVRQALERAGIAPQTVTLPSFDAVFAAGLTIIGAENWATYGPIAESAKLGADVRTRLLGARAITTEALRAAEACRLQFRAEVDALFQSVDALVLPTLPDVPLALAAAGDAAAAIRTTRFVRPFNVSGHPALTLPLQTSTGLPAGLQLVGPRGADAALCSIAHAIVG
jgi:amidase